MDAQDLQPAVVVGDPNVQFPVEAAESPQSRINGVRPVRSSNDHHLATAFDAIHQRQQLGDHAFLDLAAGLVSFWRDRIDLINEDDCGRVLLCLLESLAQVALRLSCHLGHDFRTVDEEEESSSLVGHGPRNQGFATTRRSIQEDPSRRLHPQRLEERRVPQGELDHLTNLTHRLLAASDVIVSDIVQPLLILALHWFALAMDYGVWCHNNEFARIHSNHLELHGTEATAHEEKVPLTGGAVGLQVVGLQVSVEEVACETLDGVVQREDVDALSVWHVSACMDGDDVAQADSKIFPHHLVHADLAII
mmetsp:Transcript_2893/g.6566  ORF Transcript_2893/g.6566 Transcript_2893/m.6566 type:complete len:307 (+) Transcript_2893:1305-2225(+)